MADLGSELSVVALELIALYGTSATLSLQKGTYAPTTGKRTVVAPTFSQALKIIPPYPFRKDLVNGDTIRLEDMETGVAAKDLTVPIEDGLQLTLGARVYTIISHRPIMAGDVVVLYMLHLRA